MGMIESIANRVGFVSRRQVETIVASEIGVARTQMKRAFDAAKVSRLASNWTTMPRTADQDIKAGLRQLVARSRDLAQNDDYIKGFIRLVKNNVVGSEGIKLQGRIIDPDGQPDRLANQAVEAAWSEWTKKGVPEVTGRHSFQSLLRLVVGVLVRDGELLIRKVRRDFNDFNFSLQLIDAQRLDVDHNVDLGEGRRIVMGVELDQWDRPVAYHLLKTQVVDNALGYSREYDRIPAEEIIHLFVPEDIAQTRGVPWTAAGMMKLKMLAGYAEAELVAARVASAKMGFFSRDSDGQGYEGGDVDEDSDGEDGVLSMEAEPGVIDQLPDGVSFEAWDPQHPTTAFKDFVKANIHAIASGLGVTYHALTGDLEAVNYSSGRLGRAEDQELYKAVQGLVIEAVCQPVFEEWLLFAFLSGKVVIAGRTVTATPERLAKFSRIRWQGRRWVTLDPVKEANANEKNLASRITSRSKIIRERGDDPDDVFREIAEEQEKLAALNISTETPAPAGVVDSGGSSNDDDEEN